MTSKKLEPSCPIDLSTSSGLPISGISGLGSGVSTFLGNSLTTTGTDNLVYSNKPTISIKDSDFTIQDNSDNTKQLQFQISGFSTGTTRTITIPNASDTMVNLASGQSLSNKSFSSCSFISGSILGVRTDQGLSTIIGTDSGSPAAISVSFSGFLISDAVDSSKNYGLLPSAVAGMNYTFFIRSSDGLRIVANTGDSIRVLGTISSSGGYIESSTVGDFIKLVAVDVDTWLAVSIGGTWTVA